MELEPVDSAAAVVPGAVERQAARMAGSELVAVRAAAAVEPALADSAVRAAPGAAERQGARTAGSAAAELVLADSVAPAVPVAALMAVRRAARVALEPECRAAAGWAFAVEPVAPWARSVVAQ